MFAHMVALPSLSVGAAGATIGAFNARQALRFDDGAHSEVTKDPSLFAATLSLGP
jgi:hypothetical protein